MCKAALPPIFAGFGILIGAVALATPFWTTQHNGDDVTTNGLFQICRNGHCHLKNMNKAELIAVTALLVFGVFVGLVGVVLNTSMLLLKKCFMPQPWILGATYLISGIVLSAAPSVFMFTVPEGAFTWSFILAWCAAAFQFLASTVACCCTSTSNYIRGEERWKFVSTHV